MCVICQKFYSKFPVMVYLGNGISQGEFILAQGWVKPFKPTVPHNYNYILLFLFLSILLIFELFRLNINTHGLHTVLHEYVIVMSGNFYFSFVSTSLAYFSIPKSKIIIIIIIIIIITTTDTVCAFCNHSIVIRNNIIVTPCKGIRIAESEKFWLVKSGIQFSLTKTWIRNRRRQIQNPRLSWIPLITWCSYCKYRGSGLTHSTTEPASTTQRIPSVLLLVTSSLLST